MTTPTKMFQVWTPKLMLGLLKTGLHRDRQQIRKVLVQYVDQRGLDLTDAATLHTFENSEHLKQQLNKLLTPHPGERTNLEKILALLEALSKSNLQILKGQAALSERLADLEQQITELSVFLMNRGSDPHSTSLHS